MNVILTETYGDFYMVNVTLGTPGFYGYGINLGVSIELNLGALTDLIYGDRSLGLKLGVSLG